MSYILQFLWFLGTVSVILFGSHGFIYLAIQHFFEPSGTKKWWIMFTLVLLSGSFFVSSAIAHWQDNIFTRGFYYLSSVWLWVLSNLFFIFAILWLLGGILSLFHISYVPSYLGWFGVFATAIVSGYGIWSAASPIIREDTVYIQNLPNEWEGKKIVQINDVHLGHIIRSDFAARIVEMINPIKPAAIMIVGDLFDGMDGHLEGLLNPFNNFQSEFGTFFITGNHETYLGTSKTLDIVRKTNIHIIDDTLVNLDGVQVIGIASPERGRRQNNVAATLERVGYDRSKPSILLYHTPTEIDTFRSAGISLQLAGHTHRGQIYPYNWITSLVYHGYDFGVYHEGNYTLSVSSGVGTWGPPMRTNSRSEIVVLTLRRK